MLALSPKNAHASSEVVSRQLLLLFIIIIIIIILLYNTEQDTAISGDMNRRYNI